MEAITAEKLQVEEIAESLIFAIEKARQKVLKKIKKKRKNLIKTVEDTSLIFEDLVKKWSSVFVTAGLSAGIFLATALPITYVSIPQIKIEAATPAGVEKALLRQRLLEYLQKVRFNKRVNSNLVANFVSQITGKSGRAVLDGNKIPQVYGEIATEKHLPLYPGETLAEHLQREQNPDKNSSIPMSSSLPAWGYFADSKNEVTPDLVEKEKYYLAIQTFAAEDWNTNWPTLKEWYKYRKLLVYNPVNGKAIVGVVGDAGPAKYTGRAFGGSPELLAELDIHSIGNVLIFFLDDPANQIALGPILPEEILATVGGQGQ